MGPDGFAGGEGGGDQVTRPTFAFGFVVLAIAGMPCLNAPAVLAWQQTRDVTGAPAQPADQTAQLSGRVLDAPVEGRPVRRAIVTLTGASIPAGRSAITDDAGRFTFAGVPPGDYTVKASRPAFLETAFGASRPGRPGTPIALAAGQPATDVTVVLAHGSAIEGLLRDTAGDPAPGMRVEAIRLSRNAQGERGERAGVAFTDDRGIYRLYGLPAGDYVLVATPSVVVGGLGEIGAPSEAEIDAVFAGLNRRAGGVTPPVAPQAPAPRGDAPTEPPARRGYSTPATYYPGTVSSGEAVRLTLGANDERIGADFAMKLSSAATVSGSIVSTAGQQLPQVMVQIRAFGLELPVFGGSISGGPSVTQNRGDGTFRIANVPPGRYRVSARSLGAPGSPTTSISAGGAVPPPGAGGGPVLWAETDIQVTGADLGGVTLTLQSAPRLSGRIVSAAASPKPPAASAVRVQLEPVSLPGEPSNGLTAPLAAQARADGTFEFSAVIPGAYRMTASGAAGWWPRSAELASRDLLDELVIVRGDSLTGVTLTMSDKRPSVSGTLSTPAGRPASGYFLVAFPADRAAWRWPSRRIMSTRPATSGAFEFTDLPPGEYRVAVLTDLDAADLGDPAFLDTLAAAAVTVILGEGERKTQDLRIGRE
jgi:hypothetical protein